jgi:hypothetical protein
MRTNILLFHALSISFFLKNIQKSLLINIHLDTWNLSVIYSTCFLFFSFFKHFFNALNELCIRLIFVFLRVFLSLAKSNHYHYQNAHYSYWNLMYFIVCKDLNRNLNTPYIILLTFLFIQTHIHVVAVTTKLWILLRIPSLADLLTI